MNTNSRKNSNETSQPIILAIVGGTKDIKDEFVKSCKSMPINVLKNRLTAEMGNFKASASRDNKQQKATNRLNIIANTVCKKLNITDIKQFEQDSTIKSISTLLVENKLPIVVTQNGVDIDSTLCPQMSMSAGETR